MKLITKLEILIFLQKSLCQYASNQYYNHQRYYTQAAYYEPFQNEEYTWTNRELIKTQKVQRRRKKYNDYYISADMDEGPRRLKCKCTCKSKHFQEFAQYESKPFQEYEQKDPCCQSYCDNIRDYPNGIYPQYPNQFPDTVNSVIFTPAQYPSMIYPTFDLSEIGKVFPWLTWGATKPTKPDTNGDKGEENTTMKDNRDRTSTRDDRDNTSTMDDRDRTSTRDDKSNTGFISEKYKSSTIDYGEKTEKTVQSDDRDRTSTTEAPTTESTTTATTTTITTTTTTTTATTESITSTTTDTTKQFTTESTHSTTESTLSTSPYEADEKLKKLFHHFPKKKKCLRDNNYFSQKNNKVGRYFEDDLIERPTVASYLNGRRRNKIGRKFYEEKPHYGIPIPDKIGYYSN